MKIPVSDESTIRRKPVFALIALLIVKGFLLPLHALWGASVAQATEAPAECPMHQDQAQQTDNDSCPCPDEGCCVSSNGQYAHVDSATTVINPKLSDRYIQFDGTESLRLATSAYQSRAPPQISLS